MSLLRFIALLTLALTGCARQDESVRFDDAAYVALPHSTAPQVPEQSAGWSRTSLFHLIRTAPAFLPDKSSPTEFDTHWHRLQFKVQAQRNLAVYIPRVRWPRQQGGLDVFANGVRLDSEAIVWNSPVLLTIPESAIGNTSTLTVDVALTLERGQSGGISRIWIGSADELHVRHAWREFFQQRIPQVTGISFGIVGIFTFVFWLYRRGEIAYILFSVTAGLNLLRNAHYYFANPESLGNGFWWMTINSLAWAMLAGHLFACRLHGQRFPRTERLLIGGVAFVTVGSLLAVLFGVTIERWGPLTYLVQIIVGLLVPTLSTIGSWRAGHKMALLLAVALWLNVVLGVHDFLLTNWVIDPENVILLPYGSIAVLGVFLASIGQRYLQAIQGMEQLNVSLESRLAARSRELEESHRKLRVVEQEQAVVGERQRLMREMHDGLGSSLMSSLVMVEQGKLDTTQVADVLRESIDDLTLTIDSLEPMGEDLLTLLGTLRYRLGKRLAAAGIELKWDVQETPALPWLNPTASLQILRILQETLTNVLKHAHANAIRVETGFDANRVWIRLTDNGRGFDLNATLARTDRGRGLKNLERRAATLNGSVHIESQPGATSVTLSLPR